MHHCVICRRDISVVFRLYVADATAQAPFVIFPHRGSHALIDLYCTHPACFTDDDSATAPNSRGKGFAIAHSGRILSTGNAGSGYATAYTSDPFGGPNPHGFELSDEDMATIGAAPPALVLTAAGRNTLFFAAQGGRMVHARRAVTTGPVSASGVFQAPNLQELVQSGVYSSISDRGLHAAADSGATNWAFDVILGQEALFGNASQSIDAFSILAMSAARGGAEAGAAQAHGYMNSAASAVATVPTDAWQGLLAVSGSVFTSARPSAPQRFLSILRRVPVSLCVEPVVTCTPSNDTSAGYMWRLAHHAIRDLDSVGWGDSLAASSQAVAVGAPGGNWVDVFTVNVSSMPTATFVDPLSGMAVPVVEHWTASHVAHIPAPNTNPTFVSVYEDTSENATATQRFGESIALDERYLVVAAPLHGAFDVQGSALGESHISLGGVPSGGAVFVFDNPRRKHLPRKQRTHDFAGRVFDSARAQPAVAWNTNVSPVCRSGVPLTTSNLSCEVTGQATPLRPVARAGMPTNAGSLAAPFGSSVAVDHFGAWSAVVVGMQSAGRAVVLALGDSVGLLGQTDPSRAHVHFLQWLSPNDGSGDMGATAAMGGDFVFLGAPDTFNAGVSNGLQGLPATAAPGRMFISLFCLPGRAALGSYFGLNGISQFFAACENCPAGQMSFGGVLSAGAQCLACPSPLTAGATWVRGGNCAFKCNAGFVEVGPQEACLTCSQLATRNNYHLPLNASWVDAATSTGACSWRCNAGFETLLNASLLAGGSCAPPAPPLTPFGVTVINTTAHGGILVAALPRPDTAVAPAAAVPAASSGPEQPVPLPYSALRLTVSAPSVPGQQLQQELVLDATDGLTFAGTLSGTVGEGFAYLLSPASPWAKDAVAATSATMVAQGAGAFDPAQHIVFVVRMDGLVNATVFQVEVEAAFALAGWGAAAAPAPFATKGSDGEPPCPSVPPGTLLPTAAFSTALAFSWSSAEGQSGGPDPRVGLWSVSLCVGRAPQGGTSCFAGATMNTSACEHTVVLHASRASHPLRASCVPSVLLIQGLAPDTVYHGAIVTRSGASLSPPLHLAPASTLPEGPPAPPQGVACSMSAGPSGSVQVSWEPPTLLGTRNTSSIGYVVLVARRFAAGGQDAPPAALVDAEAENAPYYGHRRRLPAGVQLAVLSKSLVAQGLQDSFGAFQGGGSVSEAVQWDVATSTSSSDDSLVITAGNGAPPQRASMWELGLSEPAQAGQGHAQLRSQRDLLPISVVLPSQVAAADALAGGSRMAVHLPPVLDAFRNSSVFVVAYSEQHGASRVSGGAVCAAAGALSPPLFPLQLQPIMPDAATASSMTTTAELPAHLSGGRYSDLQLTLSAVPTGPGASPVVTAVFPFSQLQLDADSWRAFGVPRTVSVRLPGLRPETEYSITAQWSLPGGAVSPPSAAALRQTQTASPPSSITKPQYAATDSGGVGDALASQAGAAFEFEWTDPVEPGAEQVAWYLLRITQQLQAAAAPEADYATLLRDASGSSGSSLGDVSAAYSSFAGNAANGTAVLSVLVHVSHVTTLLPAVSAQGSLTTTGQYVSGFAPRRAFTIAGVAPGMSSVFASVHCINNVFLGGVSGVQGPFTFPATPPLAGCASAPNVQVAAETPSLIPEGILGSALQLRLSLPVPSPGMRLIGLAVKPTPMGAEAVAHEHFSSERVDGGWSALTVPNDVLVQGAVLLQSQRAATSPVLRSLNATAQVAAFPGAASPPLTNLDGSSVFCAQRQGPLVVPGGVCSRGSLSDLALPASDACVASDCIALAAPGLNASVFASAGEVTRHLLGQAPCWGGGSAAGEGGLRLLASSLPGELTVLWHGDGIPEAAASSTPGDFVEAAAAVAQNCSVLHTRNTLGGWRRHAPPAAGVLVTPAASDAGFGRRATVLLQGLRAGATYNASVLAVYGSSHSHAIAVSMSHVVEATTAAVAVPRATRVSVVGLQQAGDLANATALQVALHIPDDNKRGQPVSHVVVALGPSSAVALAAMGSHPAMNHSQLLQGANTSTPFTCGPVVVFALPGGDALGQRSQRDLLLNITAFLTSGAEWPQLYVAAVLCGGLPSGGLVCGAAASADASGVGDGVQDLPLRAAGGVNTTQLVQDAAACFKAPGGNAEVRIAHPAVLLAPSAPSRTPAVVSAASVRDWAGTQAGTQAAALDQSNVPMLAVAPTVTSAGPAAAAVSVSATVPQWLISSAATSSARVHVDGLRLRLTLRALPTASAWDAFTANVDAAAVALVQCTPSQAGSKWCQGALESAPTSAAAALDSLSSLAWCSSVSATPGTTREFKFSAGELKSFAENTLQGGTQWFVAAVGALDNSSASATAATPFISCTPTSAFGYEGTGCTPVSLTVPACPGASFDVDVALVAGPTIGPWSLASSVSLGLPAAGDALPTSASQAHFVPVTDASTGPVLALHLPLSSSAWPAVLPAGALLQLHFSLPLAGATVSTFVSDWVSPLRGVPASELSLELALDAPAARVANLSSAVRSQSGGAIADTSVFIPASAFRILGLEVPSASCAYSEAATRMSSFASVPGLWAYTPLTGALRGAIASATVQLVFQLPSNSSHYFLAGQISPAASAVVGTAGSAPPPARRRTSASASAGAAARRDLTTVPEHTVTPSTAAPRGPPPVGISVTRVSQSEVRLQWSAPEVESPGVRTLCYQVEVAIDGKVAAPCSASLVQNSSNPLGYHPAAGASSVSSLSAAHLPPSSTATATWADMGAQLGGLGGQLSLAPQLNPPPTPYVGPAPLTGGFVGVEDGAFPAWYTPASAQARQGTAGVSVWDWASIGCVDAVQAATYDASGGVPLAAAGWPAPHLRPASLYLTRKSAGGVSASLLTRPAVHALLPALNASAGTPENATAASCASGNARVDLFCEAAGFSAGSIRNATSATMTARIEVDPNVMYRFRVRAVTAPVDIMGTLVARSEIVPLPSPTPRPTPSGSPSSQASPASRRQLAAAHDVVPSGTPSVYPHGAPFPPPVQVMGGIMMAIHAPLQQVDDPVWGGAAAPPPAPPLVARELLGPADVFVPPCTGGQQDCLLWHLTAQQRVGEFTVGYASDVAFVLTPPAPPLLAGGTQGVTATRQGGLSSVAEGSPDEPPLNVSISVAFSSAAGTPSELYLCQAQRADVQLLRCVSPVRPPYLGLVSGVTDTLGNTLPVCSVAAPANHTIEAGGFMGFNAVGGSGGLTGVRTFTWDYPLLMRGTPYAVQVILASPLGSITTWKAFSTLTLRASGGVSALTSAVNVKTFDHRLRFCRPPATPSAGGDGGAYPGQYRVTLTALGTAPAAGPSLSYADAQLDSPCCGGASAVQRITVVASAASDGVPSACIEVPTQNDLPDEFDRSQVPQAGVLTICPDVAYEVSVMPVTAAGPGRVATTTVLDNTCAAGCSGNGRCFKFDGKCDCIWRFGLSDCSQLYGLAFEFRIWLDPVAYAPLLAVRDTRVTIGDDSSTAPTGTARQITVQNVVGMLASMFFEQLPRTGSPILSEGAVPMSFINARSSSGNPLSGNATFPTWDNFEGAHGDPLQYNLTGGQLPPVPILDPSAVAQQIAAVPSVTLSGVLLGQDFLSAERSDSLAKSPALLTGIFNSAKRFMVMEQNLMRGMGILSARFQDTRTNDGPSPASVQLPPATACTANAASVISAGAQGDAVLGFCPSCRADLACSWNEATRACMLSGARESNSAGFLFGGSFSTSSGLSQQQFDTWKYSRLYDLNSHRTVCTSASSQATHDRAAGLSTSENDYKAVFVPTARHDLDRCTCPGPCSALSATGSALQTGSAQSYAPFGDTCRACSGRFDCVFCASTGVCRDRSTVAAWSLADAIDMCPAHSMVPNPIVSGKPSVALVRPEGLGTLAPEVGCQTSGSIHCLSACGFCSGFFSKSDCVRGLRCGWCDAPASRGGQSCTESNAAGALDGSVCEGNFFYGSADITCTIPQSLSAITLSDCQSCTLQGRVKTSRSNVAPTECSWCPSLNRCMLTEYTGVAPLMGRCPANATLPAYGNALTSLQAVRYAQPAPDGTMGAEVGAGFVPQANREQCPLTAELFCSQATSCGACLSRDVTASVSSAPEGTRCHWCPGITLLGGAVSTSSSNVPLASGASGGTCYASTVSNLQCNTALHKDFCVTGGCTAASSSVSTATNGTLSLGSVGAFPQCHGRAVGSILTSDVSFSRRVRRAAAVAAHPIAAYLPAFVARWLQADECVPVSRGGPNVVVYPPLSRCSWDLIPTRVEAGGTNIRNSLVTLQLQELDLAPGDSLTVSASSSENPDSSTPIVSFGGTSLNLEGAAVVQDAENAKAIDTYLAQLAQERLAGSPRQGALIPAFVSFDSWRGRKIESSSGYLRITLDGTNGGGAGMRATFTSREPTQLDVYFIAAIAVTSVAALLFAACAGTKLRGFFQRRRLEREAEREMGVLSSSDDGEDVPDNRATLRAVPAAVLLQLPSFVYDAKTLHETPLRDIPKEDHKCTISLGEYEEGEAVTMLPCKHHFDHESIVQWLKTKKVCPLCKRDVTMEFMLYSSEKDAAAQGAMGPEWTDKLAMGPSVEVFVNDELKAEAAREEMEEDGVHSAGGGADRTAHARSPRRSRRQRRSRRRAGDDSTASDASSDNAHSGGSSDFEVGPPRRSGDAQREAGGRTPSTERRRSRESRRRSRLRAARSDRDADPAAGVVDVVANPSRRSSEARSSVLGRSHGQRASRGTSASTTGVHSIESPLAAGRTGRRQLPPLSSTVRRSAPTSDGSESPDDQLFMHTQNVQRSTRIAAGSDSGTHSIRSVFQALQRPAAATSSANAIDDSGPRGAPGARSRAVPVRQEYNSSRSSQSSIGSAVAAMGGDVLVTMASPMHQTPPATSRASRTLSFSRVQVSPAGTGSVQSSANPLARSRNASVGGGAAAAAGSSQEAVASQANPMMSFTRKG